VAAWIANASLGCCAPHDLRKNVLFPLTAFKTAMAHSVRAETEGRKQRMEGKN